MKLNEVKEIGFYVAELDIERKIVYEVIKNSDEKWLKEDPEETLLIDEWTYENTDKDDRKHYKIYGGNLIGVKFAEPIDVIKISDTKYIISGIYGTHLMENKPTKLELANQQITTLQEQLQAEQQKVTEFRKANDKKNEFLQSLGISAGGEFRRIKYYIDKLQEQNKSLQQELRTEKENSKHLEDCLNQALKDFEAEQEKLKVLEGNLKSSENWRIRAENTNEELSLRVGIYKQALKEIKEIASFDCKCGHNQMCICNVCDEFDEILQKCEVLND